MPVGTRGGEAAERSPPSRSRPTVTVCGSSPDRAVFIESGNTDGWIATDLAVVPDP